MPRIHMLTRLLNTNINDRLFASASAGSVSRKFRSALPACTALVLLGCGGDGGDASAPPPPAPTISTQPGDQTVPMGRTATYSVKATGDSLTYQWFNNGKAIAGATSSTYVTPDTAFTDDGSKYTVTVSNARGTVTSNAAGITVTARAPATDDLRFQLVDAPATLNGWNGVGVGSSIYESLGASYSNAVGTPLWIYTPGCCGEYLEVPTTAQNVGTGYAGGPYATFADDVTDPASSLQTFMGEGVSVVNSVVLDPTDGTYFVSFRHAPSQSDYPLTMKTVAHADLADAVEQQGSSGSVVTALSLDSNGQITFLAYAWTADTTTVYETQVVTTSPDQAADAASSLAQQGYIITATGIADAGGDYVMVGTRVAGDTMARPFMVVPSEKPFTPLQQQGYAIVAVVSEGSFMWTSFGER